MMLWQNFSAASLCLCLAIHAYSAIIPSQKIIDNGIHQDGPAVLPKHQRNSLPLICPDGVQSGPRAKNILFIHGTGASGNDTWKSGLPFAFSKKGYAGCWINLPDYSLGDAQLTGEYVATYIGKLYHQSGSTPINILGHSQGNLNIQYALNFFPSTRHKVASFVSLSGDFQGTDEGPINIIGDALIGRGTFQSVLQQTVTLGEPSKFLRALNRHGNKALVPTTSTYGLQDEIIQIVQKATSLGSGGAPFTHLPVQRICPLMIVDHALILVNRVAFYLALDAFEHGSNANVQRTKKNYPDICQTTSAPGLDNMAKVELVRLTLTTLFHFNNISENARFSNLDRLRSRVEPALLPYVLNQA